MTAPQLMLMADPIHGMICLKRNDINHRLILDVMNSRAFQRLRRIKQMGMAEFVFSGATHNRFVHSIGATWLMVKTVEHLKEYYDAQELLLSPYEDSDISLEQLLILSILLHDIGHTPLSHTIEDILGLKDKGLSHDVYWNRLIIKEDKELQGIWEKYNPFLPEAVLKFNGFEPGYERHFLADLVSGQLDMDRLDYLLRDSHYLGVQYGRIEVERILTNLVIGVTPMGNQAVAIREEAVPAVEHYLFGRYEAYKMALHSLDKASEMLLKKTLERFAWVRANGIDAGHSADLFYKLMTDIRSLTTDEYLMLDDCYLWDKVNLWARYSKDSLLQQLANRLLGHDLFKYVEINSYNSNPTEDDFSFIHEKMRNHYDSRGLSFEFGFDQMKLSPRAFYQPTSSKPPIWVYSKFGRLQDFKDVSTLPLANQYTQKGERQLLFVWDREAKEYLKKILERHFLCQVR